MLPDFTRSTLADLQRYVQKAELQRGFAEQGVLEKCLLLGEEVGELFKAIREDCGLGVDARSKQHNVAEELADVLNFVLSIANRYEVDLAEALREKEAVNNKRKWT